LKTAAAAPSGAAGQEAVKKCPYCAETILKVARRCKYCKQDLVFAMTKREEITVTKLMRKVGDQWYVVNGELSSVEDNAWEAAASLG